MKDFTAVLMVVLALFGCSSTVTGQAEGQDNSLGGAPPDDDNGEDGGSSSGGKDSGDSSGGRKSTGGEESKGGSGGSQGGTGGESPKGTGGDETGGTGGVSSGGAGGDTGGTGGETGGTGGSSGGSSGGSTGGTGGSGGNPGVCEPGEKHCTGYDIEVCNAEGQWEVNQTCPFVCFDDVANVQCIGSCEPGTKQCSEDGNSQTCDAMGRWVTSSVCSNACSDGECVGSCVPGNTQCAGDDVQFCNEMGSWDNVDTCEFVCSGAGDCIGVCEPGEVDCLGDTPRTCNAEGQWESGSECPFLCSAGSCTGVCEPGDKKCSGDSGTQTCGSTGQWGSVVACPEGPHETAACSGNGNCGTSCDSGFDDCTGSAGCETNVTTTANCGACGNACNPDPNHAAPICTQFGCGFTCDEGWEDENGLPGDGCELNVYSDPDNCGAAGNSCFGGECVMGSCEFPVEEVAVIEKEEGISNSFSSMTVDGGFIYAHQDNGDVIRMGTDGSGLTVLASNAYPGDGKSLVVEGGYVYFGDDGYFSGNPGIYRVPSSGGSTEKLSSATPFHFDVENDTVYWNDGVEDHNDLCYGVSTCGKTRFYTTPVSGGPDTLVMTENHRSFSFIKVVGGTLYYIRTGGLFSGYHNLDVLEINTSTWTVSGALDDVVDGKWLLGSALTTWAPTDSAIYVSGYQTQSNGSILHKTFKLDIGGGDPTILDVSPDQDTPMIGDDDHLYLSDNGALTRAGEGWTEEVGPATGVGVLAQDASNLYWATWTYDGSGAFFLKAEK